VTNRLTPRSRDALVFDLLTLQMRRGTIPLVSWDDGTNFPKVRMQFEAIPAATHLDRKRSFSVPDDIERWKRQRDNLITLLGDFGSDAVPDHARRRADLEAWIAAIDKHIADLERRRK